MARGAHWGKGCPASLHSCPVPPTPIQIIFLILGEGQPEGGQGGFQMSGQGGGSSLVLRFPVSGAELPRPLACLPPFPTLGLSNDAHTPLAPDNQHKTPRDMQRQRCPLRPLICLRSLPNMPKPHVPEHPQRACQATLGKGWEGKKHTELLQIACQARPQSCPSHSNPSSAGWRLNGSQGSQVVLSILRAL